MTEAQFQEAMAFKAVMDEYKQILEMINNNQHLQLSVMSIGSEATTFFTIKDQKVIGKIHDIIFSHLLYLANEFELI